MKRFNQYITELHTTTDAHYDGADFSNDLSNPESIKRINSFLESLGVMEYMVPEHALNKMREKLERLSISFGDVEIAEGGKVSVPLTQFGGRFGKDENGDVNDDGISHKVDGGLSLEIVHEKTNGGTHFIRAKIV